MKDQKIPDATIERVALYLRPLEDLIKLGVHVISSDRLAEMCKVNPAQVRKDLSYFGGFGVRGVGYNIHDLIFEIKKILASDREWKLGIAGLDDMGMALLQHKNFFKRGYKFVAAFDSDPKKIGQRLPIGLTIQPIRKIKPMAQDLGIEIGVITTSPLQAQVVADMFFDAGIKAILNFSPIHIRRPDCCLVQNVDFSVTLDQLAYRLSKEV
ncbi:MAG: redox-sensing transcriptional repressor Rex [Deltaproteobacteria bacterium]|nr:redox-sensing transcriptional repressor Rex [Deltaproteobacteria bacterium]